jgi:all-trans-retinol 13,14-reductase
MKPTSVLLIGSGISSLTTALLLAKKGFSVTLLEKHAKPGGYMHCFKRFGERFDTGAHYVGAMDKGQPFHTLLSYLGIFDEDLFIPLDENGFDVFRYPDDEFQFPKGYAHLIARLSEKFPHEAKGIRDYFLEMQEAVKHFPTYMFNDDHSDMKALLYVTETSLYDVVVKYINDSNLRAILFGYCALHGVLPKDVSFGMNAILVDSLVRGPFGFKHGGDALTEKFTKEIVKYGGKILLNREVVKIVTRDGSVSEVLTAEGECYSADWIISGCHPRMTFQWLDRQDSFTPAYRDRIMNMEESIGIFGIYGIHSRPENINVLKNYYYFSDKENLSFSQDLAFLCPSDRLNQKKESLPISIHAPAPYELFKKWKGSSFGKRPEEYQKTKQAHAQKILKFIDQYTPHLSSDLTRFQTSSPLTNLHYNGSFEGSSYGIYHSIQNTGARSLGPRTKIPNLLLTGQNTLFPGLLGASISGLRTAGHIIGIKPILKELKEIMSSGS